MIELFIAFGAGLISFLSPCVLPLIPGYVSFISGQSLPNLLKFEKIKILPIILFCFGFSTVFIILGASASYLGQTLLQNSEILRIIAGIVIIIFSLQLIGLINISYLNFEKRIEAKKSQHILFPYVIGSLYGFIVVVNILYWSIGQDVDLVWRFYGLGGLVTTPLLFGYMIGNLGVSPKTGEVVK